MQHSPEDRSINIQAGRDINNPGIINLGAISGDVTNSINQLRESTVPEAEHLADALMELKVSIESENALKPEDKEQALQQVNVLAEAGQNPQDSAMQKAAKSAVRMLRGIKEELPTTVALIEGLNKLLPAITQFFGF